MTTVTLVGLAAALGSPVPIENGTIEATYWAGDKAAVRVDGANVLLPATMRTAIVAGAPAAALTVDPTGTTFCVRWRVQSGQQVLERFTSIPATGPVAFGDLPVVDPLTFAPLNPTPTMLQTFVQFRDHSGNPITDNRRVIITLTADGSDIEDITVEGG